MFLTEDLKRDTFWTKWATYDPFFKCAVWNPGLEAIASASLLHKQALAALADHEAQILESLTLQDAYRNIPGRDREAGWGSEERKMG